MRPAWGIEADVRGGEGEKRQLWFFCSLRRPFSCGAPVVGRRRS